MCLETMVGDFSLERGWEQLDSETCLKFQQSSVWWRQRRMTKNGLEYPVYAAVCIQAHVKLNGEVFKKPQRCSWVDLWWWWFLLRSMLRMCFNKLETCTPLVCWDCGPDQCQCWTHSLCGARVRIGTLVCFREFLKITDFQRQWFESIA